MDKFEKLVRTNIKEMEPYSSAREEYKQKKGIFLDANENPYGRFNRYPDPCQTTLKKEISKIKSVPAEQIFLGNGSDEAIDLLFRIFCRPGKDKVLQWTPTYGMYQVAAAVNDIEMISLPLSEDFQPDPNTLEEYLGRDEIKMMFLCSPNNPTGNILQAQYIEQILDAFQGIVVIDEAYADFSKEPSWIERIEDYPNLVVLQTLSKAWGLAALRIGMAIAQPWIISYFNKVKPPYNISQANQDWAIERLKKPEEYQEEVEQIIAERKFLEGRLRELDKIQKVFPSDANFLLIKVNDGPASYDQLLDHGLIVRDRSRLVNNTLRISVGTEEENRKLINTLQNI